jgi:predicted acetyltransferase
MDVYGSLKATVTQLRTAIRRQQAGVMTTTMTQCSQLLDLSPFVHVTLIATHPQYRGLGCARICLLAELIRWAQRGRWQMYLNMALEKRVVDGKIVCQVPEKSRRLYESFGFDDVFPRRGKDAEEFHWTKKEADMGRTMVQLNFPASIERLSATLVEFLSKRPQRLDRTDGAVGRFVELRVKHPA